MRNLLFFVLNVSFLPSYSQHTFFTKHRTDALADSFFNKYQQTQLTESNFKYIKQAIRYQPRDSFFMYLANSYMLMGNYHKARKVIIKGMSTNLQSGVYDHILIDQYFVTMSVTGGLQRANKLLESYNGDSVIFRGHFFKAITKSNRLKDVEILNEHVNEEIQNWLSKPDSAEYFCIIAHTYFRHGLKTKANQYFTKAKNFNPKDSCYLYYLGRMLMDKGKFSRAYKTLVKAKAAGASDAETYMRIIEKIRECRGC